MPGQMRDIGWIKMLTLFVCQYRSNPFNSQEIYDYRCLDGKVDILGNRYPQQGPQLTLYDSNNGPRHVEQRATAISRLGWR